eukprot:scaffold1525_cov142-Cylindrotheca_fusiformis.AAC.108
MEWACKELASRMDVGHGQLVLVGHNNPPVFVTGKEASQSQASTLCLRQYEQHTVPLYSLDVFKHTVVYRNEYLCLARVEVDYGCAVCQSNRNVYRLHIDPTISKFCQRAIAMKNYATSSTNIAASESSMATGIEL